MEISFAYAEMSFKVVIDSSAHASMYRRGGVGEKLTFNIYPWLIFLKLNTMRQKQYCMIA